MNTQTIKQMNSSKIWNIAKPIPQAAKEALRDYPPILQQLLYNREVENVGQAHSFLNDSGSLHDPFLIKDMEKAIKRIQQAIDRGELIAIYGDYDVDGITATVLLTQVLEKLGAKVTGHIPNRFREGYGLYNGTLEKMSKQGVGLIVTVDCGIRSPVETAYAYELGMDMIITDHHLPKGDLPKAAAVLNVKQEGDEYPFKLLSGVGVAFKIAEALSKGATWKLDINQWLDLVAMGTVADIVPLTGENRSLVKAGLTIMRTGRRTSLKALAGAAGMDLTHVNASSIGFILGPRLNAAGRLELEDERMGNIGYQLLMTEDAQDAGYLAQVLDDLNKQRQDETRKLFEAAEEKIQAEPLGKLIFATDENFNMGLVGLAASRLTEKYYLPSIVGQQREEYTRASCRSIPEFHITKALDECVDLLVRHGGHEMAAGFTVRNELLGELKERLLEIANREFGEMELRPTEDVDMEIELRHLQPAILDELKKLEPTGMENPEAVFLSRNLKVRRSRTVGSDNTHLKLDVTDGWVTYSAIAFRQGHWEQDMPEEIDILYTYEVNRFNGKEYLQLNIRDIRPSQV